MKVARLSIMKAVEGCMLDGVKKATVYQHPKMVVKVTRRHKNRKNDRTNEFVLAIGAPNYLERKFIRDCQKAGEPFPVRNVQIKE